MPSMDGDVVATETETKDQSGESFVSLKTLAAQWNCSKTTVSRLLDKAGVPAFYFGRGRNGLKRYKKEDIDRFVQNLDSA